MSDFSFPLSRVTTPEHYLVKEHFDEVEELAGSKHPLAFVGQAYGALVEPKEVGRVRRSRLSATVDPEQFGLVVVGRTEVGFPPQSGPPFSVSGDRAVQVGSFLKFVDSLNREAFPNLNGFGPQRTEFVNQAAWLVKHLIDQSEATR